MTSISARGIAEAATVTPESSATQPSTATSQIAVSAGRSSGRASNAAASDRSRNLAGQASISAATMTTAGTIGLYTVVVREPMLALTLRCTMPPEPPCSTCPTNAPMSDGPVAGTK